MRKCEDLGHVHRVPFSPRACKSVWSKLRLRHTQAVPGRQFHAPDWVLDAVVRLVRPIDSPTEARVMQPLVTREIAYRLLVGAQVIACVT